MRASLSSETTQMPMLARSMLPKVGEGGRRRDEGGWLGVSGRRLRG